MTRKTRSYNMSQIKGKDTKPELIVRKFLIQSWIQITDCMIRNYQETDIVLPKYRTVIFVNVVFGMDTIIAGIL